MKKKWGVYALSITLIAMVFVFTGASFISYINSRKTAEKLVGASLDYFPLSKTRITLLSFAESKIVWAFEFSSPKTTDTDFEIYVSLTGKHVITNPKDLVSRIRNWESSGSYPYSN